MGVSLLIFAWRLSQAASKWSARLLMAGAILLTTGYALILPLYEAGKIERFGPGLALAGDPASALAWHVVKLVSMNAGWLLFGWGLSIHAGLFHVHKAKTTPHAVLVPSPR
ncbi:hypothetical protein [Luteolibacter sp. LG18]|uniref:hypothetical protein n=1 Tax=Luteolibacter sp. LG18 TaxID=2819286 RepID=UPI0030C6B6F2